MTNAVMLAQCYRDIQFGYSDDRHHSPGNWFAFPTDFLCITIYIDCVNLIAKLPRIEVISIKS